MPKFSRRFAFMAIALGVLICANSTPARADLRLTLSETGFADSVMLFSGNAFTTGMISYGHFTIEIDTGVTNFTGTPVFGNLTTTTNSTRDTSPTGVQTLKVQVDVTATGNVALTGNLGIFTAPGGATGTPMNLNNQGSTTGVSVLTAGEGMTATSTSNGVTTAPVALTTVPNAGQTNATFTLAGGGYTLQNTTLITLGTTLGVGDTLATTTSSTVTTVVPEPSTIAAALSGVGLVGLGALRRKFRNRA